MGVEVNYILTKLTARDLEEIECFADARCGDSKHYQRRGNFKRSDITTGAAAEIGAYKALKKAGFEISKPDFGIYHKSKKSFNADLSDGERHFHVKGQSVESATLYGASWLLQKEDPMIKVPLPGHYLMCCLVDYEKKAVYTYCNVPVMTLVREDLFDKLKIDYLNRTKVAVYLKRLTRDLQTNQRWSILYDAVRS